MAPEVQEEFGRRFQFDFSRVRVHTNDDAARAASALRARAYTTGTDIVFGRGTYTDREQRRSILAHELVHVMQQSRPDIGGPSSLHAAEAEADSIPPASELRGRRQVRQHVRPGTIQCLGERLDAPLPATAPQPAFGEDIGQQRRYSIEQFIDLWEMEQGRRLTSNEKQTLARGCIGITALNVDGSGNPPLDLAYGTFEKAKSIADAMNAVIDGIRGARLPSGVPKPPQGTRAIVFAQLFWSNQAADPAIRRTPDPKAYQADAEGRVSMRGYQYRARPGYVNFDYGFWDDSTQSFWHANHMQPGMKVYQSTRDKFTKGYIDFDRIVYCVAVARNYDPRKAAISEALRGAGRP